MKKSFAHHLKGKFSSKELSDEQWMQIEQTIASQTPRPKKLLLKICAGLAAAMIVAYVSIPLLKGNVSDATLAEEIVYNHRKQVGMEIETAEVAAIRARLDRLDFSVVMPESPITKGLALFGARYCSLNGKIAAQMRWQAQGSDEGMTMYQSRIPDGYDAPLSPRHILQDGTHVYLWKEKDLLIGMATPIALTTP